MGADGQGLGYGLEGGSMIRINENVLKDSAVNVINSYHLTRTYTLPNVGVLPGRRFSRSNLFGGVGC